MGKAIGEAKLQLPYGTIITIETAIYAREAQKNLLSFTDIRKNGYFSGKYSHAEGGKQKFTLDWI